jgi:hypothetical protein
VRGPPPIIRALVPTIHTLISITGALISECPIVCAVVTTSNRTRISDASVRRLRCKILPRSAFAPGPSAHPQAKPQPPPCANQLHGRGGGRSGTRRSRRSTTTCSSCSPKTAPTETAALTSRSCSAEDPGAEAKAARPHSGICNSPLGDANLRYRSESSEEKRAMGLGLETFNGARHASPMAATVGEFSLLPVCN